MPIMFFPQVTGVLLFGHHYVLLSYYYDSTHVIVVFLIFVNFPSSKKKLFCFWRAACRPARHFSILRLLACTEYCIYRSHLTYLRSEKPKTKQTTIAGIGAIHKIQSTPGVVDINKRISTTSTVV